MKRIFIVALVFAGIPSLSFSQKSAWTLDDCVSYTLENNISLKRQELTTELNKKDLSQSKLNVLPNLNGQVEHNIGSGRVLDRGTYQWLNTDVNQGDLGLVSNVTLFNGLTGYNSIKMSEANYLISKSNLEVLENNLQLQVMNAYLELLLKMELYDIAVEKVKITELQVERMEMLLEVGNASAGELLEVKAQNSEEKYNLTYASTTLEGTRLSLMQLMNLEFDKAFTIVMPEIQDPSLLQIPDLSTVYSNALAVLPEVEGAEHNISYQERSLALARGALSPELYVRALYYSNYSDKLINPREIDPYNPVLDYPLNDQVFDNQYKQVSIGLNIPVFNKWQNRTNISKAKIGLQDAEYLLEDTKQKLFKSVQQYHADARGAFVNFQAAQESAINSEEAYRYAEEKFKIGMATALEMEEARNRLFASRSEMITTKYVFIFYLKILDFYQGKEMSFL